VVMRIDATAGSGQKAPGSPRPFRCDLHGASTLAQLLPIEGRVIASDDLPLVRNYVRAANSQWAIPEVWGGRFPPLCCLICPPRPSRRSAIHREADQLEALAEEGVEGMDDYENTRNVATGCS
jgi:hypothetical protein